MLDLGNRILLNDGISIVDDDKALQYLLSEGELPNHIKVLESDDTEKYKTKYKKDITHELGDTTVVPDTSYNEEEFNGICIKTFNSNRAVEDIHVHSERFRIEQDYFVRNGHQHLIVKLYHLIQRFREDDVVWGVGRGSACASYIFYLMGVHDVNSIKYDLEFKEFSKEELDDD